MHSAQYAPEDHTGGLREETQGTVAGARGIKQRHVLCKHLTSGRGSRSKLALSLTTRDNPPLCNEIFQRQKSGCLFLVPGGGGVPLPPPLREQ